MISNPPQPLADGTASPSTPIGPEPSSFAGSFESGKLLAGRAEIQIRHGAETYRLRVTRQNRLILTK